MTIYTVDVDTIDANCKKTCCWLHLSITERHALLDTVLEHVRRIVRAEGQTAGEVPSRAAVVALGGGGGPGPGRGAGLGGGGSLCGGGGSVVISVQKFEV